MSSVEINILRFIFTLDNILVALIPWFKVTVVAFVALIIVLATRRIVRGKTRIVR